MGKTGELRPQEKRCKVKEIEEKKGSRKQEKERGRQQCGVVEQIMSQCVMPKRESPEFYGGMA